MAALCSGMQARFAVLCLASVVINPLIATLKPQSIGPSYINTVISTLAVDEWAVTFGCYIVMPPPRGHNAVIVVRPSVRPSDVAYIGSNSKAKRLRKTKLCTGVPQVTCDSHTDYAP